MTRGRENRVEGTSDSWVTLNSWSMAADCPLAWSMAADCPLAATAPDDMPMVVTKFASDAADPLAELL